MTPDEAYRHIAEIAKDHGLIYQASRGVIVIVHQDTQKEQGIFQKCQYMAGLGPFPKTEEG